MTPSRHDFWAHCTWDDPSAHGESICSPGFKTQDDLRTWTTQTRLNHAQRPGFALHPYRREFAFDTAGKPVSYIDVSLMTVEYQPSRERHMEFVAKLGQTLKDAHRPTPSRLQPHDQPA